MPSWRTEVSDYFVGWFGYHANWSSPWTIPTLAFRHIWFLIGLLTHVPYQIVKSILKKKRKKHRLEQFKKKFILSYEIYDWKNFNEFWMDKGLPKFYIDQILEVNIGFHENTIVECIVEWHEIFCRNESARLISSEIIAKNQELIDSIYRKGGRISIEPTSQTLLRRINFKF